ncbi:hypothetical protein RD792_017676 [Penstemon davidsonii]|uniref:Uncharacterized protein n=1 Tax=Penstemon davidsonii TaxID=160366 RepID=A0ABR0DW33_9LAMI|nr:hypothetical protein RD792_017676 [Penstemon davidsonii]
MGAGPSHEDHALEPNEEQQSKIPPESSNSDAKAIQTTTVKEASLPHNCEDILKHADSPVDKTSPKKLCEQLYGGKYWIVKESNSNCFTLFARDLSITWAEDHRFWHWPLFNESSDESVPVAELLNVCWLEVHGRFEISNLTPGIKYEVVFIVKLKDPAYGWEVPVNLRLTLPDGTKQEHKESLIEKPREKWVEIPAGEFKASAEKFGEIEFSLYEYEGGKWKKGLLIKGVSIKPKTS